ncbi:nucleotidyltransferase [Myxococcota bacterium]|nr:nucleotidyltransferase [Myxococcota bacterium]
MTPAPRPLLSALPVILDTLEAFGQPFALIGGLAVVLRARPRLTRDLDFVVSVPPGQVDALLECAARTGLSWDPAEVAQFAPGGLLRLWSPPDAARGVSLDLLFADDPLSVSLLARARPVEVLGRLVPVATVEDLILTKLDANRPQDLDDVVALVDAHAGALDRAYLRAWATRLDLSARLAAFTG